MNVPNIYLPYRFYGFDQKVLKKKLLSDLSNYHVTRADKMIAAWRPLPWDSKHFHLKMLELAHFIADEGANLDDRHVMMKEMLDDWHGYEHVTARINAFDILSAQTAEKFGFSLADTNVEYGIDLRRVPIQRFDGSVFEGEGAKYEVVRCPCDLPELVRIAKISWSEAKVAIDRFHADTGLPEKLSDDVYAEWLKNCLTGELADYVVVPRVDGKAVGFLALKQHADKVGDTDIGLLGLAAIDPSMRGKRIYTNMISLGLRVLKREAGIVETGTQVTNYAVQKAWVQLGLKLVTTTYVFHKWLTGRKDSL
jgi:hypothetical protein